MPGAISIQALVLTALLALGAARAGVAQDRVAPSPGTEVGGHRSSGAAVPSGQGTAGCAHLHRGISKRAPADTDEGGPRNPRNRRKSSGPRPGVKTGWRLPSRSDRRLLEQALSVGEGCG